MPLPKETIGKSWTSICEYFNYKVEDALHVATVYEMDALITWNNRHLANLRKMEKINSINLKEGYTKHLELVNPMEVITDENR